MGQFFDSTPTAAEPRRERWPQEVPRTWKAALGIDEPAPAGMADEGAPAEGAGRPGHRLGPGDGTLSLRTGRNGAAAKAGHDLLIRVTRWDAVLATGDDGAEPGLALDIDGGSLRVVEGSGGMKALTDSDKADISTTIDDEILKRQPIVFRSTRVEPDGGDGRLLVEGDLTLLGQTRPLAFHVLAAPDGALTARTVITQSLWGIEPYSTLFGTLRVNDDVAVELDARLPQSR